MSSLPTPRGCMNDPAACAYGCVLGLLHQRPRDICKWFGLIREPGGSSLWFHRVHPSFRLFVRYYLQVECLPFLWFFLEIFSGHLGVVSLISLISLTKTNQTALKEGPS